MRWLLGATAVSSIAWCERVPGSGDAMNTTTSLDVSPMICAGGRLFKITVFLSVSTVSEKAHCSWGLATPSCSMRDVANKEVTSALASVQTAKKQDQRASAGMMEAAKGLRRLKPTSTCHSSTSSNELNTTLTPITHGDACFAYFNKIWGIPSRPCASVVTGPTRYSIIWAPRKIVSFSRAVRI